VLLVLKIMGIFAIEAMGLGLINGFTGQFSLGHATFMGIGAYTAALLTSKLMDLPFIPALILGGLAAALVALLLGVPVFFLKGDYVVMITLALNLIFVNLLLNFGYAGGSSGFAGIKAYSTLSWIYVWVVLTYIILRNVIFSTHGRAILAIREDETAAPLVGVNPYKYKLISFSMGCFFAGIGGGLFAHTILVIAPANFTIYTSVEILVMTLLGGTGSLVGAGLGAVVLRLILEVLRPLGLWRVLIAPVLVLLIIIFRPIGLYGLREPGFLCDHWVDEPLTSRRRKLREAREIGSSSS
jgi:branched-chain amino acid transport system permease protein